MVILDVWMMESAVNKQSVCSDPPEQNATSLGHPATADKQPKASGTNAAAIYARHNIIMLDLYLNFTLK